MNAMIQFQHLIDPENCARCGSCEAECEVLAISHDDRNFVIDADKCSACQACIEVCPTGAVDSWLKIQNGKTFSVSEQLQWDSLPAPVAQAEAIGDALVTDADVVPVLVSSAPASAATPRANLYSVHAPVTASVIENRCLTDSSDVRHIVLDFGASDMPVLEGQTIGILAPGVDAHGKPHAMRAYSIASARDGEKAGSNTVALTVKRIVEDYEGNPVRGVCSNYLCDRAPGDEVKVVGPFGHTFLAPNAPTSKIMMICTGTGIAPMRGMIERRRRHPVNLDDGDMMLFYGARTANEMAYFDDLIGISSAILDLQLAFSRVPEQPREYVQDLLLKQEAKVMSWLLDENTCVYLCGVRGMEEGVEAAFEKIGTLYGIDWAQLKQKMREKGRWHVEVY